MIVTRAYLGWTATSIVVAVASALLVAGILRLSIETGILCFALGMA